MQRPARLSSECYSNPQACFVTICTWQRRPLLTDPTVADVVISRLTAVAEQHVFDVAAYCLMPDHLHVLLVFERDEVQVRASIERIKQLTAYAYTRRTYERLWQRSYFDRTLRSDDGIESTVAYIVNNPIRAGFVMLPESWPFWGSSRWSRQDLLATIAATGPGCRPG